MNDTLARDHAQASPDRLRRDRARIRSEIAGTTGGIDPFPAAVRATRMPIVVTDLRQFDNPIAFVRVELCRLTGQLLVFARQHPLQPEVGRQASSVAEMIRSLIVSRIALDVVLPDTLLHTEADVTQFETAPVNLAVTARVALQGAGCPSIAVNAEAFLAPLHRNSRR